MSGTRNLTPPAPGYYTYTLTCTWPGGSGSQTTQLTAYGPTPSRTEQGGVLFHYADFYLPPPNQIVGLQTSMTVPPLPPVPANGAAALFLWPGLQPAAGSAKLLPQPGVLQPVLTWGQSCAPVQQPPAFSSWWISAEYYSPAGCQSGDAMMVEPGDVLLIRLALDPSSGDWTETVTDARSGGSVQFVINLLGESQNWIDFAIESWFGAAMSTPLEFTDTTITFQSPDEGGWCSSAQGEQNAYAMTPPTAQAGGTQCTIARIVLNP